MKPYGWDAQREQWTARRELKHRRAQLRKRARRVARSIIAAALLSGCATVAPPPAPRVAPEGVAVPCRAGEPAPSDGVLLPVPLAAYLASSETCCRDCKAELERRPSEVPAWIWAVGGALAGSAATYAVIEAGR